MFLEWLLVVSKIHHLSRVSGTHYYQEGLSYPLCPTRSTEPRLFLLLLRSHVAFSLSFSHSQTTLVLIKPRGLTFSPRYLECCTKSILRPCQPGNKTWLFHFGISLPLFLFTVRSKLKCGLPTALRSFYLFFVSGELTFKDIMFKILWHKFSMVYTVLKLFCCFVLTNVINRSTIIAHLNLTSRIKSPTFFEFGDYRK